MNNQIFTEKEVTEIIRRAVRLESEQQNKDAEKQGLSLDELVTVASEAGLDPENIRIAANQLQSKPETPSAQKENPERGYVFAEKWVNNRLSDELTDSVIAELKHRYDASEAERNWLEEWRDDNWEEHFGKSIVQQTGRSVEWKHIDKSGNIETRVLIQPRGKQIRIKVAKRNLWESPEEGPGAEIYEYMAAIPFVTGLILFITMPYTLFVNLLIAFIVFIGLEFTVSPLVKKIRQKWGGRLFYRNQARIEDNQSMYQEEVNRAADDIWQILQTELDESMISGVRMIESDHLENALRKPEGQQAENRPGNRHQTS